MGPESPIELALSCGSVADAGTKHVYSAHCYYGENHDDNEVKCVFAKEEIPGMYEYRFVVRPCECYGGKGNPIFSEWQKPLDSKR